MPPAPMRTRAMLAALAIAATAPVAAQPSPGCGEPVQNYVPRLPAPGEAYVSVSTDLRGLAPVKPAIVVNILLPAGARPLVARGRFLLGRGDAGPALDLARAEFWVLGPGPRAAAEAADTAIFPARSDAFQTQYKLTLRVPPEAPEQFVVTFPALLSADRPVVIPALAFRRTRSGPQIEICSVLPD